MAVSDSNDEMLTIEFPEGGTADDPRVVIVGGGVVGCAAARELAANHRVLVLERDRIAGGATAKAAGEVTMTPTYTDRPAIADHATEFFRTYDGTGAFEYIETPSVELVTPAREEPARARVERLRESGIDVSFLDPADVESRWPRLDASAFSGAVLFPETGHVDPYTLATTLRDDAEKRGARFETGVTVTDVTVDRGSADGVDEGEVTGVDTDHGAVSANVVVAAAGWRTRELLEPIVQLPVRPYRTQCLVLRPETDFSGSFPMGWIPGEHVYFRPERNGDLLVGGWSFAEDDPESSSPNADERFRNHVAGLVPRFLRSDGAVRMVDGWAGVDGATPDTRPIVDTPEEGPEDLVVATGFHGRGIMTAPVAATLVERLVTGENPPFASEPFSLSRFDDHSADFEFLSISAGGDSD